MANEQVLVVDDDDLLVAQSPAMAEVVALVAKVAPTNAPILIRGEPGSGKALVAIAVHRKSHRADMPLVHFNCGAVHEAEIEPDLLGHGGQLTEGGEQICRGLLEYANGKTIFLDHVEHLPTWTQLQLYDAMRRGWLDRGALGPPVPLDVRWIASTSADLEAAVAEGRFCQGLYYCLNVVPVRVPPLRQRPQDLKPLIERCLAHATAPKPDAAEKPRPYHFTPKAWECLLSHDWPGNLFELSNVVARAVALSPGPDIGKEAIVLGPRTASQSGTDAVSVPLAGNLYEMERSIVDEFIRRHGGNKAAAARALGMHRRTLYRILEPNRTARPDHEE
jgi:DNA-binding NtrC family response regulator